MTLTLLGPKSEKGCYIQWLTLLGLKSEKGCYIQWLTLLGLKSEKGCYIQWLLPCLAWSLRKAAIYNDSYPAWPEVWERLLYTMTYPAWPEVWERLLYTMTLTLLGLKSHTLHPVHAYTQRPIHHGALLFRLHRTEISPFHTRCVCVCLNTCLYSCKS
jgi:hypothetical protein